MLKGGQELAYKDEEAAELIFPFPSVSKCALVIYLQEETKKLRMMLKVQRKRRNSNTCECCELFPL
jgi:hypothetical protein